MSWRIWHGDAPGRTHEYSRMAMSDCGAPQYYLEHLCKTVSMACGALLRMSRRPARGEMTVSNNIVSRLNRRQWAPGSHLRNRNTRPQPSTSPGGRRRRPVAQCRSHTPGGQLFVESEANLRSTDDAEQFRNHPAQRGENPGRCHLQARRNQPRTRRNLRDLRRLHFRQTHRTRTQPAHGAGLARKSVGPRVYSIARFELHEAGSGGGRSCCSITPAFRQAPATISPSAGRLITGTAGQVSRGTPLTIP